LDLKDAFFTILLHQLSQYFYTFEWEDPITKEKQQCTYSVLLQGFWVTSQLFARALEKDVKDLQVEE
jgi:hypothetical protein